MLYADGDDILFLEELQTNTKTFSVAIRNDRKDTAVAFVDKDNHARSLRKARHSLNVKKQHKIKAIYVKERNESSFETRIYYNKMI